MIQLPAEFEERMKQLLGGEYCWFAESYEKERAQGLRMNHALSQSFSAAVR